MDGKGLIGWKGMEDSRTFVLGRKDVSKSMRKPKGKETVVKVELFERKKTNMGQFLGVKRTCSGRG